MKRLIDQISDYDANELQFAAYTFYVDKLNLNWERFPDVKSFVRAKEKGLISESRLPRPGRAVINLSKNKIVNFYFQNRWEYDGLYISRDSQLLEYVRSKIYYGNADCSTCGSEGVNDLDQYQAQVRFVCFNPNTLEKTSFIKFLSPNFCIKYDYKTERETDIKRFYLSLVNAPSEVIELIPEDFFDNFKFHSVTVFEASGDMFIELFF